MAKKHAKNVSRGAAKLPAGFTATSAGGGFGDWHDFNAHPVLTGKVVDTGSYTGEYGKQRTITVQNGKLLSSVSESKGLKGLFDTAKIKGKTVYIRYLGTVKVGKKRKDGTQKSFKKYISGVKQ